MEDKKYIIHHIDEELSALDKLQSIYDDPARDIEKYFIAYEASPRPHFHLLTYSTEKTYNALMATIKRAFNLVAKQKKMRTENKKGGRCLYTRVKDPTQSYEKFLTYIQKEGTGLFKYKGFTPSEVEELGKLSFKKNEPKKNCEKLIEHLEKVWKRPEQLKKKHPDFSQIQNDTLFEIYRYINATDINLSLSRTAINNYYLNYLRKTEHYNMEKRIYCQMYFNSHLSN